MLTFQNTDASEIQYSIKSVHNDEITVDFTVEQKENSEKQFYFAYPDPDQFNADVLLSATLTGTSESIHIKKISRSYSGKIPLQWCTFYLKNLKKSYPLHGTITIRYNRILFNAVRLEDFSVRNGIIRAPINLSLAKVKIPADNLPFSNGIRIEVSEDGIYSISSSDLVSMGIPVDKIASRTFRLFNRGKEIPIYISNSQRNNLSSDDFLLFYGRHLRGKSSEYEQFSNTNVYWLTWGKTAGSRVAEISGERQKSLTDYTNSDLIKAVQFYDTVHFEVDTDIRYLGNVEDAPTEELFDPPDADTSLDNWYWGFIGEEELTSYRITVPSPAASGLARMQISFTGLSSLDSVNNDHQVRILLNNNPAGNNNVASWDGQRSYLFTSDTFSVTQLKSGLNVVSFLCPSLGYIDRSALNWIRLEYDRNYQAVNDRIEFKNSTDGIDALVEYQLSGFSSDQLELWDINQNRFFTKFSVFKGSGNQRNTFTIAFQDSVSQKTTYLAQTKAHRLTPSLMIPDTIRTDWDKLAGYQYIVISVDSFKTELEPLLQLHNSRGLSAAFVSIEDIYNYFSGGIRDPESIRAFIQYLFSISGPNPPRYLLLGGDTSHDLDKKNRNRNIIPTRLSRIPGWGPAADDSYFATVWGNDNFADLYVGRFPAQDRNQMRFMVEKTIRYIKTPQRGFWRDNMLLLGGGEAEFSRFNEESTREIIRQKMNISRIEADSGSRFYKYGSTASKIIADKINAGVFLINFNGHGGGNIWSDNNFFGYKDLSRLYNGQWGKSGHLPMVFSFTCLTGFFESVFYRSLGEEFLRNGPHGCIGFYGASAYTSMRGNLIMNKLMLETAFNGQTETIGELIDFCEMSMLVRYGPQYLPLIRQYNLLGDPALPWKLTADTLDMALNNASLKDDDSLKLHCNTAPVTNGNIKVTINTDMEEWFQTIEPITDGQFSATYPVKSNIASAAGTVRAYAWNDSTEVRGWLTFSKDSILVYDIQISPQDPFFGDSVLISCKLTLDSSMLPANVYCMYDLGATASKDHPFTGIRMISTDNNRWVSSQKIPLTLKNDLSEKLLIYFRVMTPLKSRESELFSFNIRGRPDLLFTDDSLSIQWINDSLRINATILNSGNASSPPFHIHFFWNTDNRIDDTILTLSCSDSLAPGKSRGFSFALPDTQGKLFYSGWVNYQESFAELDHHNNRVNGYACINYRDLTTPQDTLKTECNSVMVVPAQAKKQKQRIFMFTEKIKGAAPLKNSSQWVPLVCNNQAVQFSLYGRAAISATDTLIWTFNIDTARQSGIDGYKFAVMAFDSVIKVWKSSGSVTTSAQSIQMKSASSGPLALAVIKDLQPPDIQVAVAGRTLNFTDYAAKDKPFSIFISDPSGIDPRSVSVLLNGKTLDSDRISSVEQSDALENLSITAYPQTQYKIDSLQITAMDLAGNSTTRTVTYQPGEELSIRFLACHPNPFTAQKMPNGSIRNVRFAFLLTDVADNVTLAIYTVSGKPVQSWSFPSLIGYQEIKWNGRDRDGAPIANGTYYAKLVAKNRQKKVTKIIRIAKLEGY